MTPSQPANPSAASPTHGAHGQPHALDAAYGGAFLRAGLTRLAVALSVTILASAGTLLAAVRFADAAPATSMLAASAVAFILAMVSYARAIGRIRRRLATTTDLTIQSLNAPEILGSINPLWHGTALRQFASTLSAAGATGMILRLHPRAEPPRTLTPFPHRFEPLRLADVERLDDPAPPPPRSRYSGLTHGRIMLLLVAGTAVMLLALFLTPAPLRPAALPFVLIGLLGYVPLLHWLGRLTTVQVVNQSIVLPMGARWRAFERAASVMLMYHAPWSQWWYVTIADGRGVFQVQLRTRAAEALLRAWLSPVEPLPIERWTDYA